MPALQALAQSRKDTLVIGIDTSDSTELDPVRDLHYTPPMTISACYETLRHDGAGRLHQPEARARHALGAHARRQGLALHACATTSSSSAAIR